MLKSVYYVFDEELQEQLGVVAVRVTVKTVSIRELGERAKLQRQYRERLEKQIGKPLHKLSESEREAVDEVASAEYQMLLRWAHMRVSLKSVETLPRQAAGFFALPGDSAEQPATVAEQLLAAPWVAADLAALGWDKPDGVLSMPGDLFTDWDIAAQAANPRLFGPYIETGEGVEEKKVGTIRVS